MRYTTRCPGANASSCRAWATRDPAATSAGPRRPGTAHLLRRRLMTQRSDPLVDRGQLAWRGSGVYHPGRLEEHQVTFFRRVRAMLGVSWNDEELAGTKGDVVSIS